MEKPKRSDEKYWTGTNQFDEIQFANDLEEYITELEAKLANPTEPLTKPPCGKWTKEKPKEPCVFMTKMWNKSLGIFDYNIWRFEKIKDDDGWYLGWLTEDGDEWDDIERCNYDEYYIIEYFKD